MLSRENSEIVLQVDGERGSGGGPGGNGGEVHEKEARRGAKASDARRDGGGGLTRKQELFGTAGWTPRHDCASRRYVSHESSCACANTKPI